jgi:HAD superfamily hydrolase (TIGR01549 family)
MDGVLIEGRGTHPAVYREAARRSLSELGVAATDERTRTLGAPTYSEAMAEACRALDLDPEAFWSLRERFASRLANRRIDRGARRAYDDLGVLPELAQRRAIGVASNNRQATVAFVVERLGLECVSAYRGRDPTIAGYRRRKPDSYYLDRVLAELDADEALYVGDRETDIEAAGAAGVDSAYLRRPHNRDHVLGTDPTYELDGLEGLHEVV